mmetsp:Transcript_14401/g.40650  ORF Transcript_14401/g.40650 Transcript_14401/m.40650 type:complete len:202 (+) Transcript_14401:1027-1632(+)
MKWRRWRRQKPSSQSRSLPCGASSLTGSCRRKNRSAMALCCATRLTAGVWRSLWTASWRCAAASSPLRGAPAAGVRLHPTCRASTSSPCSLPTLARLPRQWTMTCLSFGRSCWPASSCGNGTVTALRALPPMLSWSRSTGASLRCGGDCSWKPSCTTGPPPRSSCKRRGRRRRRRKGVGLRPWRGAATPLRTTAERWPSWW